MAEHMENLIRENARVAQDQDEYAKKEETFGRLYEEKHSRYEELEDKIQQKIHKSMWKGIRKDAFFLWENDSYYDIIIY